MNRSTHFFRILSGTFLIAGTMIGAGMLGIPLVTAAAGFWPGFLTTCLVWLFMFATGLIFLEVTLWLPDGHHILSISHHFLGGWGKLLSGVMFIFLYYCLMIAYFAAGAPLLGEAFGGRLDGWKSFALFGSIFGFIVAIGPKSIDRVNILMSIAMIGSWFLLIGIGASDVEIERINFTRFSSMFLAMPVLFSAFGFHNVIPSLCSYLKRDRKALRLSIFLGSFLPLLVYLVWQWLIIGSVPREAIFMGYQQKTSVMTLFQTDTGQKMFVFIGRFFAFFAIITSLLGVSFSMVDFLGDGFRISERKGAKRLLLTFITFFPPFVFSLLNPHIFTTALGVAGGFGEAFLNGLLPITLIWMGKYRLKYQTDLIFLGNRYFLMFLMIFTFFVVGVEVFEFI